MIPKILYEVLPYLYLFVSLLMLMFFPEWVGLGFAWLLFTAASVTWVLRSDARRVNKRVPTKEKVFFLHHDLYESMPFGFLGIGALAVQFAPTDTYLALGVISLLIGTLILGMRIVKRKISWIDEWRRYRGPASASGLVNKRKYSLAVCDRCVLKEKCRGCGLTDTSNSLIMKWLQGDPLRADKDELTRRLNSVEVYPVRDDKLLKVLSALRPVAKQCHVWRHNKEEQLHQLQPRPHSLAEHMAQSARRKS